MAQIVDNVKGKIQNLESIFEKMKANPNPVNFASSIRVLREDDPEFKKVYGRVPNLLAFESYINTLNNKDTKDEILLEINEARFNVVSLLRFYELNNPVNVPYVSDPDRPQLYFGEGEGMRLSKDDRPPVEWGKH